MIPDHILETAMDAYADATPDGRCTRVNMNAALESVAAHIWDEGWSQGMAYVTGMERGTDDDDLDHTTTNPYRASEGK